MLSQFESERLIDGIITQNVDGLHYEAGSVNVYELHGSLRQVICLDCSLIQPMNGVMERVGRGENPPLCENCNGVLKPNAVFFGEKLSN
jgi:NAD-dependent deacetylase